MTSLDHVGICPADFDASLRFYRDGLGLDVLFDVTLDLDLEPLLGVSTERPRTLFLSQRDRPGAAVELIDLGEGPPEPGAPGGGRPHRGAFLISFQVAVEETLQRLQSLGLGGEPRRMTTVGGGVSATVVDPDGVMVELLDRPISLS